MLKFFQQPYEQVSENQENNSRCWKSKVKAETIGNMLQARPLLSVEEQSQHLRWKILHQTVLPVCPETLALFFFCQMLADLQSTSTIFGCHFTLIKKSPVVPSWDGLWPFLCSATSLHSFTKPNISSLLQDPPSLTVLVLSPVMSLKLKLPPVFPRALSLLPSIHQLRPCLSGHHA